MRDLTTKVLAVILLLLPRLPAAGQATSAPALSPGDGTQAPAAVSPDDRVTGWRADLKSLSETLASKHKNAFSITSRERFDAAVNDLDARIPQLEDWRLYLEFKRLVAMVGDAHTNIDDSHGRFPRRYYPFSVLILADGTYVTATTEAQRSLLGKRIVRIGTVSIDEAITRLGSIVPHENKSWLLAQVKNWIMSPEALAFVGLAETAEEAQFTFMDAQGEETTAMLAAMQPHERQSPTPKLAAHKLAQTLQPRTGNAIYGSMMLPESRDLYVWYDACRNDKDKTVKQFAEDALAVIDRDKPQRVIIDLRRNSGGNSSLINPLVYGLATREYAKDSGRLYVLIGRGTFSSGLWAAEDFKKKAHAILVGEPTGGKPNSFGEQRSVQLPHSGLTLYYSTKKWVREPDGDPASLEPDVLANPTFQDLVNGRDPVVEVALSPTPK